MKFRLFLLVLLSAALPAVAQSIRLQGSVVDASTGAPLKGAVVTLRTQEVGSSSTAAGEFVVPGLAAGQDYVIVACDGYQPFGVQVELPATGVYELSEVKLVPLQPASTEYVAEFTDLIFDESVMEDEEGTAQNIAALTGANDNIYYNTASYNFGPMYFRFRGYDSQYQSVYINGIEMNDVLRGRFNFSSLLGMTSRAFRNKTTTVGLDAANYGFGDIGGSVNYNTVTDTYAPGFNGSVAYTNSNYMLRAMLTYSTGMSEKGWALTLSAITRWSNEGVIEGTYYNSFGLFMSMEKRINNHNSITFTAFGGPTERATASATYQEAYDLAGTNLYNPNWGYYQGKKRAARITNTFDPTMMLNWLYKKDNTTLNVAAATRWVNYSQAALQYYKANDPNPTYYRYLPSYYKDNQELFDLYTYNWEHNVDTRQIKWDELYYINELNNVQNEHLPADKQKGSSYIQESRISDQFNAMFSAYLNQRLNSCMTLQGGLSFNYTNGSFYKKVRDLMGGEFWLDVDPFSDRDITLRPDNLQNDLDNPNRHVGLGQKFGYHYNMYAYRANAWLQNMINTRKWDVSYGLKIGYTQYQREGFMRNGRAPYNSLGRGKRHIFDDAVIKAGATYKLNGRNYFQANAEYGTRAPLVDNIYISPRIKDTAVDDPQSERILAGDLSYIWNYRRFRGRISAYYTEIADATERWGFYDERYNTYTNFVLSGVKRVYKGVELGMSYKITPSLTATFAGTYAKYQYKNNPQGTRSFENGLFPDTTQTVYLKNFYAGSTPQTVANLGLDWAAPHNWFLGVNCTYQGDAYVNLSPAYHEALPGLVENFPALSEEEIFEKVKELAAQDKLHGQYSLNASIGKAFYFRGWSLNVNLNANNILNNRNVVTYAYQQGRLDTKNYNPDAYPNRYTYAQGIRLFLNLGVRF